VKLCYFINNGISLSLRFNGHIAAGRGLAGTRMSALWILLELRMMEMVVTSVAIRRVKLQSNRHHLQTNTQSSHSCHPPNSVNTGFVQIVEKSGNSWNLK